MNGKNPMKFQSIFTLLLIGAYVLEQIIGQLRQVAAREEAELNGMDL